MLYFASDVSIMLQIQHPLPKNTFKYQIQVILSNQNEIRVSKLALSTGICETKYLLSLSPLTAINVQFLEPVSFRGCWPECWVDGREASSGHQSDHVSPCAAYRAESFSVLPWTHPSHSPAMKCCTSSCLSPPSRRSANVMYLYLNIQASFCPDVFVRSFKEPTSLPLLTPIIFFKLLISWPRKRDAFVLPTGNSLLSNSIKFSFLIHGILLKRSMYIFV